MEPLFLKEGALGVRCSIQAELPGHKNYIQSALKNLIISYKLCLFLFRSPPDIQPNHNCQKNRSPPTDLNSIRNFHIQACNKTSNQNNPRRSLQQKCFRPFLHVISSGTIFKSITIIKESCGGAGVRSNGQDLRSLNFGSAIAQGSLSNPVAFCLPGFESLPPHFYFFIKPRRVCPIILNRSRDK